MTRKTDAGKIRRRRIRPALVIVAFLAVGGSVRAQDEGVRAGKVVFYPSLDASYLFEDNVFLTNPNDPNFGVLDSGQQYYVANLKWELPFSRSSTSITWSPRLRLYGNQAVDLPDNFSNYFNFDSDLKFASGFRLRIDERYVRDNVTIRQFVGPEVAFGTDTFRTNDLGIRGEHSLLINHKIGGEFRSRILRFADETSPSFFDTDGVDLTLRYQYNPVSDKTLTTEYIFGGTNQDRNQFCSALSPNAYASCDTDAQCGPGGVCVVAEDYDANALMISWESKRENRGTYKIRGGYKILDFQDSRNSNFSGAVGDVNVSYQLGPNTALRGRAGREALASFFDAPNYYVVDSVEATFDREVTVRISWNVKGTYEWSQYPDPIENLSGNYGPSLGVKRRDRNLRAEAGVEFRLYRTLTFGAFGRYQARNSNVLADSNGVIPGGVIYPVFDYNSTAAGFQLKFGWE